MEAHDDLRLSLMVRMPRQAHVIRRGRTAGRRIEDGEVKPRVRTVVDIWKKDRRKGFRLS